MWLWTGNEMIKWNDDSRKWNDDLKKWNEKNKMKTVFQHD